MGKKEEACRWWQEEVSAQGLRLVVIGCMLGNLCWQRSIPVGPADMPWTHFVLVREVLLTAALLPYASSKLTEPPYEMEHRSNIRGLWVACRESMVSKSSRVALPH